MEEKIKELEERIEKLEHALVVMSSMALPLGPEARGELLELLGKK